MKAVWNGQVIADADKQDLVYIEGNWYFPPSSVKREFLHKTDTQYTCPWKGDCEFYDVGQAGDKLEDGAWAYPKPLRSAIEKVKKDFSGFIAFYHEIQVTE